MALIILRDLQYRRRPFALTALAAAGVIALGLLLSGVGNGFREEAGTTVASLGVHRWVVPEGASGPFTSSAPIPQDTVGRVAELPEVTRAGAVATFRTDVVRSGAVSPAHVIGYPVDTLGDLGLVAGRDPREPGEAAVDRSLGAAVEDTISAQGVELRVVGLTEGHTAYMGVPNVYVPLRDAQDIGFGGQAVATAFVLRGAPDRAPPGFALRSNARAAADLLRPAGMWIDTIARVRLFLWALVVLIVGSAMYVSVHRRSRELAVMKAVGATCRQLASGLVVQATVLGGVAGVIAAMVAPALAPLVPIEVDIEAGTSVAMLGVAAAAGLAAGMAGLPRVAAIDPDMAFGAGP